jgi:acyl-CoA synthetase (AMP-forming)/AMP-acid ligase II
VTLHTVVPEAARRFGDAPAFVDAAGWTMSYAQLDRLSDETAMALAADHHIESGDLVALTLPSTLEYVVTYAALAKLGAITAGVNPRYTGAERASVLRVADPVLVVTTADLIDAETGAHAAIDADPGGRRLVVDIASDADDVLADLRAPHRGATPPPLADAEDPERLVAVVFTSGTTGTPKGAMFGRRELAAIARSDLGDRADAWGGGGPMLAATQFAHVGFMTKLPWYLQLGTTTYLIDRWRATDVLRLVHDTRMASIGGVAPQMALMLGDPTFDDYDFSCVKTIIMGGALSPPDLVRRARQRFGAAYSIRYSSTESGGVGTATAFDADDDEALFTVGRPRGDVQIEIRGDDGAPVTAGEVGEICLRSSCMMRGYWHDAEATAEARSGGWLHTGDLGRLDPEGRLLLAGRAKEMFIRGGYNVYPLEVEAVLASHPAVAHVAVVPRPDPVMGEIGVAVVVPRDTNDVPTLDELRTFAAESLSRYKLPERLRVVDDLPLTAMQKVDRRALADVEAPSPPSIGR